VTQYSRGATFERLVKADLEFKGYFVQRSAGSHGPCDLLALRLDDQLAVQCKTNGKLPPAERTKLLALAKVCHLKPVLAWRPKRGVIEYRKVE
jgi:Holliday junction resolvase